MSTTASRGGVMRRGRGRSFRVRRAIVRTSRVVRQPIAGLDWRERSVCRQWDGTLSGGSVRTTGSRAAWPEEQLADGGGEEGARAGRIRRARVDFLGGGVDQGEPALHEPVR